MEAEKERDRVGPVLTGVIGLFAYLGCIAVLFTFREYETDPWSVAEVITQVAAAVAVIWALLYALEQVKEAKRGRSLEIVDRLYQEFTDPVKTADRRFVIVGLPPGDVDVRQVLTDLSQDDRSKMKSVLNSLDRAYLLTRGDYIDDDDVLPWLSPMVVKVWERLDPYVQFVRETRGEKDYYDGAEDVYWRCKRWQAANVKDVDARAVLDSDAPTI